MTVYLTLPSQNIALSSKKVVVFHSKQKKKPYRTHNMVSYRTHKVVCLLRHSTVFLVCSKKHKQLTMFVIDSLHCNNNQGQLVKIKGILCLHFYLGHLARYTLCCSRGLSCLIDFQPTLLSTTKKQVESLASQQNNQLIHSQHMELQIVFLDSDMTILVPFLVLDFIKQVLFFHCSRSFLSRNYFHSWFCVKGSTHSQG